MAIELLPEDTGPIKESDTPDRATEPELILPDDTSDQIVWCYPSSNAQGKGQPYQFRGVPELKFWMDQIIHSHRFPYPTEQYILRHAIHKHMDWLQGFPGCPRAPGTVQLEMMRILEEEEYDQQFSMLLTRTDGQIAKALSSGNPAAAERLISRLWNAIKQLAPGPWREKYLGEFNYRYGKFLK